MKFVCLVYLEENKITAASAAEWAKLCQQSMEYDERLSREGHLVAAAALHPVTAAKTLQVRKGQVLVTDGPFAETKEHLGGLILVEAKDWDDALQIAAGIPLATFGRIEIRPLMGFR